MWGAGLPRGVKKRTVEGKEKIVTKRGKGS